MKDLGVESLVKRDWEGADPEAPLQNRATPSRCFREISHHLLVGALGRNERHLVSVLFGDGVVPLSSAAGGPGAADRVRRPTGARRASPAGGDHFALAHQRTSTPRSGRGAKRSIHEGWRG